MSISRIKTIAIATLVLVNIFFVSFIVLDAAADARIEREAIENVCAILRASGIMLDPDDVSTAGAIRTMKTTRVVESEEAIARAILGRTEMSSQGVIHLYENAERGTAEFASAGDFEIRLNQGVVTNSTGTMRTAERLLYDMKLETSRLVYSMGQGSDTVAAVSSYKGASIFNCAIEFIFTEDNLDLIKGRYVTGFTVAEGGVEISSVGTALLGFLSAVLNDEREDVSCTHIFSVEAGYQYRVAGVSGEGSISPAWLISTDEGRYLIDDATGEILTI